LSKVSLFAVSIMIGTFDVFLIALQTSQPSMTGSMISSSIMSGSKTFASATPVAPSPAILTRNPSFSR
jgi:hypothetical protein